MGEIVFLSRYAGFFGGVERYMFQASERLRKVGYTTRLVYREESRAFALFCQGFDRAEVLSEKTDFSSAAAITVHKFEEIDELRVLLERHREKLILFVHDHDFYCPRHHKYTFFGRKNCDRPYRYLRCSLCSMTVSPRFYRKCGLFAFLRDNWIKFPRLLRLYRSFPKVVVLSDFMRENLRKNGFPAEAIHLIPPTVDVPPYTPPPKQGHILFIGQLVYGKGGMDFLDMLGCLKRDFTADIVGDGNELPAMKRRAEELGIAAKVNFVLWQTDPERFFTRASLVVLPFRWQEPFGLVGLEAAAHGRAVVAYDRGGCRQWLHDGETGFLVEPGKPELLAERVAELLDDPEKLVAFGKRGRELAEKEFSVANWLFNFACLLKNDEGKP